MNRIGVVEGGLGQSSSGPAAAMSWTADTSSKPKPETELSDKEMEAVTTVFRSFETGLREASIDTKDLVAALKMLGLNPMEQEIIDVTNEIARNGLIYFPEFCKVVKTRYRSDDEEVFRQNMFKVCCLLFRFCKSIITFRCSVVQIHFPNIIVPKSIEFMIIS